MVKMALGGVAPEWTRGDNPVGWTEAYDYQRHGIDILLNGYAEVDLFLKGLKYKFNVGINKYTRRNYAYSSPYYFSSTSQKNEAELSESTDWENDWLIENTSIMIIRLAIIRFLLWWVILPSVTMRVVLVQDVRVSRKVSL